jgi:hypothetical protein
MSMGEQSELLLTAREVAQILRLKPSTVFDAAARGKLPCVRLWRGKRKSVVRFRRKDIIALVEGSPIEQPTPPSGSPKGLRR